MRQPRTPSPVFSEILHFNLHEELKNAVCYDEPQELDYLDEDIQMCPIISHSADLESSMEVDTTTSPAISSAFARDASRDVAPSMDVDPRPEDISHFLPLSGKTFFLLDPTARTRPIATLIEKLGGVLVSQFWDVTAENMDSRVSNESDASVHRWRSTVPVEISYALARGTTASNEYAAADARGVPILREDFVDQVARENALPRDEKEYRIQSQEPAPFTPWLGRTIFCICSPASARELAELCLNLGAGTVLTGQVLRVAGGIAAVVHEHRLGSERKRVEKVCEVVMSVAALRIAIATRNYAHFRR